ncbi:hypothetical protein FKP32DRAFT_1671659 [Trametes sanguinea]|nr:hypothetical protein FKP32DRAFT_1671659 [Trametes sanguinea]
MQNLSSHSRITVNGQSDERNSGDLILDPESAGDKDTFKRRTVAYHFMAIPLLDFYADIPDDIVHDIESYYWVLLWVVLRHTRSHRHAKEDGEILCKKLFKAYYDDDSACGAKIGWLLHKLPLTVLDNEPLSTLNHRFKMMVAFSQTDLFHPIPRARLTYSAVLEAFDEALAKDAWPKDDWKPYGLLQEPRAGIAPAPIVHDTVPGYKIYSEGRALRSNTGSNAKPATALPTVPAASGSGSPAPAERPGTKRANADDALEPSGATQSRKRLKTSGSRSLNHRSGRKAAPTLTRQAVRRSSRIKAMKQREV